MNYRKSKKKSSGYRKGGGPVLGKLYDLAISEDEDKDNLSPRMTQEEEKEIREDLMNLYNQISKLQSEEGKKKAENENREREKKLLNKKAEKRIAEAKKDEERRADLFRSRGGTQKKKFRRSLRHINLKTRKSRKSRK